MAELTPEIAADVVAACQAGAEEAAGALSRSLDGEFQLTVGEAGNYDADNAPDGFDGPGLALVLKIGGIGVVALLPEASGLLPDWVADPDPTGVSKLCTLAQELSMLLVPEEFIADDFSASHVENLQKALADGSVAEGAGLVPLAMSGGEKQGELTLIWPVAKPDAMLPAEPEPAEPEPEATPAPSAAPVVKQTAIEDFCHLPPYARTLLKIQVPVTVTLAAKKKTVGEIMDLGAGSIIKFEKSCKELLDLNVNNECIAKGEVVKIGEKFGLKIHEINLPKEQFETATRSAS